jgi:hypothetical protein
VADNTDEACLSPLRVERWLRAAPVEVVGAGNTSGSSGAKILTLRVRGADGSVTLRAKWRKFGDSYLNDARKEIAAYAVQKLLFEPYAYVVPPTTGRCFPIETYQRAIGEAAEATFAEFPCVFGSLSYWLEGVESADLYDEERFWSEPDYRQAVADSNAFTFVIQHGDTHAGNFLVMNTARTTRIYSPDNAIAFNPYFRNPLDLINPSWYDLRVPALRRDVVERLRQVELRDVAWLRVIEQYRNHETGLTPEASGAPLPGDEPVRFSDTTLQIGLSDAEISRVHERIREIRARVNSGEVGVF